MEDCPELSRRERRSHAGSSSRFDAQKRYLSTCWSARTESRQRSFRRARSFYSFVRDSRRPDSDLRSRSGGRSLMSGAPSPGPLCRECGAPKTTRTEELTYSSTRTDSETKSNHGTADLASLVGEHNHEDTETVGETTGKTSVTTTAICPTPGCPQRKRDRWELRRWQLDTDPALSDTPETREWEIQEIVTDEKRYVKEMDVLLSTSGTPERDRDRRERTTRGEQAPQRPDERHEREQPPRRETDGEPSDGEWSPSTPTDSRAWGDTDERGITRWGHRRDSDTNEETGSNSTA